MTTKQYIFKSQRPWPPRRRHPEAYGRGCRFRRPSRRSVSIYQACSKILRLSVGRSRPSAIVKTGIDRLSTWPPNLRQKEQGPQEGVQEQCVSLLPTGEGEARPPSDI